MKTLSGFIVDYMINAPCNLKCPFCYGPNPKLKGEIERSDKLLLIDSLKRFGVNKIVIAGGEPTLSPDLLTVCQYAHSKNIGVGLQTNSFSLPKINSVLPFLDWIAFSLDGMKEKSQIIMRTDPHHFEKFKQSIALVTEYNQINLKKIKLKIGTVTSAYNIEELIDISGVLNEYNIDVWKLYKIRKRGKGVDIYDEYQIEDDIVLDKLKVIKKFYPTLQINYSFEESISDSYIIIDPDSRTYVIHGATQTDFGKIIDKNQFNDNKFKDILSRSNQGLIHQNIQKSFPGWL